MGLYRDNVTNNRKKYNGLKSQLVGGIFYKRGERFELGLPRTNLASSQGRT